MAYAASLVRMSGTPIMLAASSSSRMASQARPSRPSRIRSEPNMSTAVSRQNRMYFGSTSDGSRSLQVSAPSGVNARKRG